MLFKSESRTNLFFAILIPLLVSHVRQKQQQQKKNQ